MAFEYNTYPERQFVLVCVSGNVTLEENIEIGHRILNTLEQSEECTDVFFDLREIGRFPLSLKQLRQSSAIIRTPKLGWFILLMDNNPVLRFVATVLLRAQTTTEHIRVFNSLEDALTFMHGTQENTQARRDWIGELRDTLDIRVKRFSA